MAPVNETIAQKISSKTSAMNRSMNQGASNTSSVLANRIAGSAHESQVDQNASEDMLLSLTQDPSKLPQSNPEASNDLPTQQTVNQLIDEYDKFDALNNLDKGETSIDEQTKSVQES